MNSFPAGISNMLNKNLNFSYAHSVIQSLYFLDSSKYLFDFMNYNNMRNNALFPLSNELLNIYECIKQGKTANSQNILFYYYKYYEENKYNIQSKNVLKPDPFHFIYFLSQFLHIETNITKIFDNSLYNQRLEVMKNDDSIYKMFLEFLLTQNSIISNIFFNTVRYTYCCEKKCGWYYFYGLQNIFRMKLDSVRQYRDESNPNRKGDNLELSDLFLSYCGANPINCKHCGSKSIKRYTKLLYPAKIIIISLERKKHFFKNDLNFLFEFDIDNFITKTRTQGMNINSYYELKAVISYFKSDNVGKYFADCKIKGNMNQNMWVRYIDYNYFPVNPEEVLIYEPQILIYEVKNNNNMNMNNNINFNMMNQPNFNYNNINNRMMNNNNHMMINNNYELNNNNNMMMNFNNNNLNNINNGINNNMMNNNMMNKNFNNNNNMKNTTIMNNNMNSNIVNINMNNNLMNNTMIMNNNRISNNILNTNININHKMNNNMGSNNKNNINLNKKNNINNDNDDENYKNSNKQNNNDDENYKNSNKQNNNDDEHYKNSNKQNNNDDENYKNSNNKSNNQNNNADEHYKNHNNINNMNFNYNNNINININNNMNNNININNNSSEENMKKLIKQFKEDNSLSPVQPSLFSNMKLSNNFKNLKLENNKINIINPLHNNQFMLQINDFNKNSDKNNQIDINKFNNNEEININEAQERNKKLFKNMDFNYAS